MTPAQRAARQLACRRPEMSGAGIEWADLFLQKYAASNAEQQLEERGSYIILIARFIPFGRTAVTFTAGYTKGLASLVEQASRSAPAGSEGAINAMKSTVAATSAGMVRRTLAICVCSLYEGTTTATVFVGGLNLGKSL